MKQTILSTAALSLVLGASAFAQVEVFDSIPGSMITGGMVMPEINFDHVNKAVSVALPSGQSDTVVMKPLQGYFPGATFDPSTEMHNWYDLLAPEEGHLQFNSQFGFTSGSGSAPAGSLVFIELLSISDGLKGYFYEFGHGHDDDGMGPMSMPGDIELVFNEAGDIEVWNNVMWHPLFIADAPGFYSATFSIYLVDEFNELPLDGWTPGSITLNWGTQAIPEPSSFVLLGGALAAGAFCQWRRKRSSSR